MGLDAAETVRTLPATQSRPPPPSNRALVEPCLPQLPVWGWRSPSLSMVPRVLSQDLDNWEGEYDWERAGKPPAYLAEQEVYPGLSGSTTPGDSPFSSAGTPNAPSAKCTPPPLCGLLFLALPSVEARARSPVNWPRSMGQGETTNLSYSATFWETKVVSFQ